MLLRAFVDSRGSTGRPLSSVPQLVREYEEFAERGRASSCSSSGPASRPACRSATTTRARWARTGSRTRSPRGSATARRAVVVDFGTSTNFDVVSAAGEYAGGVLAPGVEISMDALFARAARLPRVPFVGARARDRPDDDAALQSGLVYGFAGQVDAIVDRIRDELARRGPVVATGGLAELIAPHRGRSRRSTRSSHSRACASSGAANRLTWLSHRRRPRSAASSSTSSPVGQIGLERLEHLARAGGGGEKPASTSSMSAAGRAPA